MKELTECLNTRRKINEINDKLYELRASVLSPKSQVITGMPRSGGGGDNNAIERYMIRAEKLTEKVERLEAYQAEQWEIVLSRAKEARISVRNIELLYYRYVKGLSWKVCTAKMKKKYKWWNINTSFRKHRETLYALDKIG